jgi:hypothetical protein
MRLFICALVLCTTSTVAWAIEDEEPMILVGPQRHDCYRNTLSTADAQWTIKGDVEVGEVLHVLARLACERFLVTREMMHQRVTIAITSEKLPVRELRSRVVGALRANGVAVEMDMVHRVQKGGQDHDAFGGSVPPPPPPMRSYTQAVSESELDAGISCSGTRCELKRALFDRMLADSTGLATGARIVPSIKDNKPNGLKLYGIRAKSYVGRLGLQNGDTLTAVNGSDISSPDKALEVYAKIRQASKVTLSLIRRGEPTTQEIVIK